jgi:transposase
MPWTRNDSSHNSLGVFYRRMRARLGPKSAIVATAHKIARVIYHLLTHHIPFRERSAADHAQRAQKRQIATMRLKAASLGFTLVELPT